MYMHGYNGGGLLASLGFGMVCYTMVVWWRDVIREATFEGHHTSTVQTGLKYGMLLFIVSEIMFFFAFFWAFFHSALAPTIEIGAMWPPKGIEVLNPWEIPFLNTVILLTSGATVTWAHHALREDKRRACIAWMWATVVLGSIFLFFQAEEYIEAYTELNLTLGSGIYGSTFFMLTGFHGMHVTLGTLMLIIITLRLMRGHFKPESHFGFEGVAWYWHFVDVVWLGLFVFVYVI